VATLVKFQHISLILPDFSVYFPWRHQYLSNHQRYTDRPTCTSEWILWQYWQYMSTWLNIMQVIFILWLSQLQQHMTGKPQFPWFPRTNVKFPDFSRFSRRAVTLINIQGAPIKSNPLGKILYLWNCSKLCHQIYTVYRGEFRPHILHAILKCAFWKVNK